MTQRHLVGVWNPSYADADIMAAHVDVLLDHVRHIRALAQSDAARTQDRRSVGVWWGIVHSRNREHPLPHLERILAMDDSARDPTQEVHLYLTDYRSLYVGHLVRVAAGSGVRLEPAAVPSYYTANSLRCDCWLGLADIRRLVADDTPEVIAQLAQLKNTAYHDRPVSLYGGMVDLPLIVTRPHEVRFFESELSNELIGDKLWAEFDAVTGPGAIEQDLRENLLGDAPWRGLDARVRGFVATAEHILRKERRTVGFDYSTVLINLAKACELQTNLVLQPAMLSASARAREVYAARQRECHAPSGHLSLGDLAKLLAEDPVRSALRGCLKEGGWFTTTWPHELRGIARMRNDAAHTGKIALSTFLPFRNQMLGVGCEGYLVQLSRVDSKADQR